MGLVRSDTRTEPDLYPPALEVPLRINAKLRRQLLSQVIEHLDPRYLTRLLDAAFDKLRPGAPIVLETINPACWFAFFESYIRDITHVRPLHPDTLNANVERINKLLFTWLDYAAVGRRP